MKAPPSARVNSFAQTAASTRARRKLDAGLRRGCDLTVALLTFAFLLPLLVAVALAVWIQDGGPVLFGHVRIGKEGRTFRCLKFRSMVLDADRRLQALLSVSPQARAEWARDHKLKDDPRITWLGRFLRTYSLDELPQLINVIRGEMSLVGLRPIVTAEIERYGRHFARYCSVTPGITGLWQVSGRSDVSYRRRVVMDVMYVRSLSASMYAWILVATLPAVLLRRGAV